MRHRILLQTDPLHVMTGLSQNARTLLKYLYKTGRYDLGHYCVQGTPTNHPLLGATPWQSFGSIPPNQDLINQINADPNLARDASYGAVNIDAVIKEWKPTIWIGANDIWSFPTSAYCDKPWYNRINSIPHITVDSIPVLDQAYEQAKRSKTYLTWAKFAVREMKRFGGAAMSHVDQIYGAMDVSTFSPISESEKADLRRKFNIAPDTVIFQFVFRNQLRKQANRILEGFARFKKEHPNVRAALHFHTSFSEKAMGWDIPKMMAFYGIAPTDVLCTYVCKTCGSWFVAPYGGEDLDCPACGAKKSIITTNIVNGVPGDQMKYLYGIADAALSCASSGGQELTCCQSLLCGKVLASTNYSSGEDFCLPETRDFVTPLRWHPYDEQGTNFIKAATDVGDITSFMRSFVRQPKRALEAAGEKGRDWAVKTFGIETIGAQWEKLFATMPTNMDWSSIDITKPAKKNDTLPMPDIVDNAKWVETLYREILLMNVGPNDEGRKHWLDKLAGGMPRQAIYDYFLSVAKQENQKNGHGGTQPVDFASLLDKTTGRKRALMVIKQSIGDCLMITALLEDFHKKHPGYDLYIGTESAYISVFDGNPHVFRVLPYIPAMENEMMMIGSGQAKEMSYFDLYMHPAIQSQRQLNYLSNPIAIIVP